VPQTNESAAFATTTVISSAEREGATKRREAFLSAVLPRFVGPSAGDTVVKRSIPGLPRAVGYVTDSGDAWAPVSTRALDSQRVTADELHERALGNLMSWSRPIDPSLEPVALDEPDGNAAIQLILLPERVPEGKAWIAYCVSHDGVLVIEEGARYADDELRRVQRYREENSDVDWPLDQPLRVTSAGFAPYPWPAPERRTDPGGAE
jgi:hypothetical protein